MSSFHEDLAHGWQQLSEGDLKGAEAAARRAVAADENSAEAHNLDGACAAAMGRAEAALRAYERALALDDHYFEALIGAAEVCVARLSLYDSALEFCEQALELAESDEELVEVLLLTLEALIEKHGGAPPAERRDEVFARLPSPPYASPDHNFRAGRVLYEMGDVSAATPLIRESALRNPTHGEAWYYLGLLLDEQGDAKEATAAFLKARELDCSAPSATWSLPKGEFRKLVEQEAEQLTEVDPKGLLATAHLLVSDVPGVELVADGIDPRAPVFIDGLKEPKPRRRPRVFFYQRNLERLANHAALLNEAVRDALERELARVEKRNEA